MNQDDLSKRALPNALLRGALTGLACWMTASGAWAQVQMPAATPSTGWAVRFSAVAGPGPGLEPAAGVELPITTKEGNVLDHYDLAFNGRATLVISPEKKASLVGDRATFLHAAKWKNAAGQEQDYRFAGAGALRCSGQLEGELLKLQLEWAVGVGAGSVSGKPLTKPMAAPQAKSDWSLKPAKVQARFGPGEPREVAGFAGVRRTTMPQELAGCPPLTLVERVEIHKLPTADLEIALLDTRDPAAADKRVGLKVTVKNLGPETAHGVELSLLLPEGAKIVSPKELENREPGLGPVSHALGELAKGATTEWEIAFEDNSPRAADVKTVESTALARVSTLAFDPHPGNDGKFVSLARMPK
jgi:hypothetical protein